MPGIGLCVRGLRRVLGRALIFGVCLPLGFHTATAAPPGQDKRTDRIAYDLRLAGSWHGMMWGQYLFQVNCAPTKNPFLLSCVAVGISSKKEWKGSPVVWGMFSARALKSDKVTYYKLSVEKVSPFLKDSDIKDTQFAIFEILDRGELQARFADRDFLAELARRGEIPTRRVGEDVKPDLKRVDLSRVLSKYGAKRVFPRGVGPFYPTTRNQKPLAGVD